MSLFSPWELGPVTLRNRIVKAATYESMARQGVVTDGLIDFHRTVAAGGAAMTTVAYCSVSPDGRTFRDQLLMRQEAIPGLRHLTDAVHAENAAAALQLGHAGWFADPRATRCRPTGPSATFSPHAQCFARAMQDDDFSRIREDFARSARMAVESGFDALEIHLGHGYLLSQFLTPWNNRRRDAYGGTPERRARFPREVLRAVRDAVGDRVAVYAKLNMSDGFRRGLGIEEGIQVARWLEEDGTLDALQLTGGHTTRTPMFLMRGDSPLPTLAAREQNPLRRFVFRIVGARMMAAPPFSEAFFLDDARRFRAALDLPLMLLGGVTEQKTMESAVVEGFDAVVLGRALLADPDLPLRMASGNASKSMCTHCNLCVASVGHEPTRCVLTPG